MVAIPVALKHLIRIVLLFQPQKLANLWITAFKLILARPPAIRQVVAPAVADPEIDEVAERVRRAIERGGRMLDMQIEDHAGIAVARPSQTRLVILLNQADCPVNHVGLPLAQGDAGLLHERRQPRPLHIDFRNHLGRLHLHAERAIQIGVVTGEPAETAPKNKHRGTEPTERLGSTRSGLRSRPLSPLPGAASNRSAFPLRFGPSSARSALRSRVFLRPRDFVFSCFRDFAISWWPLCL